MDEREGKRLHDDVGLLGLRAHATAVGFIQLTIELRRAGVLDDAAVDRIKSAIANDLMLSRPIGRGKAEFEQSNRRRLDALFAGAAQLERDSVAGESLSEPFATAPRGAT